MNIITVAIDKNILFVIIGATAIEILMLDSKI
jgi:hypothetical protein